MKKHLFLLLVFVLIFAPLGLLAEDGRDFYFQKQILVNGNYTCQAVQIDRDWLLTAAHCVAPFVTKEQEEGTNTCNVRVVVAQGSKADAQASAVLPCSNVFLPESVTDGNKKSALPFDLALIYFPPTWTQYEYHTLDWEYISDEQFQDKLEQDSLLRDQWDKWHEASFPALYTYRSAKAKLLENVIIVPLWTDGKFSSSATASQIVYIGGKFPSLWVTKGFGVENGNSGGAVAVVLPNGKLGILGIVSAKTFNIMDDEMRQGISQVLPGFEQTEKYFFFYGFADKDSLSFIKETLKSHGDSPIIKKIKEVPTNLLEPQPSLKKIKAR